MFSADIDRPSPYVIDIWTMDLATGELRNLTDTDAHWEEHARYSPNGRKIAWASSQCFSDYDPRRLTSLRTEVFLMSADGSDKTQLTHFNTPGFTEYTTEQSVGAPYSWSPDGSQLALVQLLSGRSYWSNEGRRIWILTFAGECGA
jgi:Tol biopolymer transport system component